MLDRLNSLVYRLNNDNSNKYKEEQLRMHSGDDELKRILFYTYNPFYQFNVTSKNCIKNRSLSTQKYEDFFDLLDDLRLRNITGHDAISAVNGFVDLNPEYEELIYRVIDKDLKTRTGEKLINKAIPNLIPSFKVALAEKYEPSMVEFPQRSIILHEFLIKRSGWYVSRKLDGVRCIIIVDEDGDVESYSRQGKRFDTLGIVEQEIKSIGLTNVVFDGEICMVDENGNESFQGVMKEIRKKNHTMENAMFKIFDCLSLTEFTLGEGDTPLQQRLLHLLAFLDSEDIPHISVLEQELVRDEEHFQEWVTRASDEGWEGVMIRKNIGYEGKRTKNLLKVKTFHDDEYVVTGVESNLIRHIVEGVDVEEEMLSRIMIEHKGNEVGVGSGFSMEQRRLFHENPNLILGKTVTIQYFEESQNQDGEYSLRFPVLKHIFENGRDV
jgi:DNA ligase 1